MNRGTRRRPLGEHFHFRFRLGLCRRAFVVSWRADGAELLSLSFLFHSSILKPDLDLSFGEVERQRHLDARCPTEVFVQAELPFQFYQLLGCERRSRSLATT